MDKKPRLGSDPMEWIRGKEIAKNLSQNGSLERR